MRISTKHSKGAVFVHMGFFFQLRFSEDTKLIGMPLLIQEKTMLSQIHVILSFFSLVLEFISRFKRERKSILCFKYGSSGEKFEVSAVSQSILLSWIIFWFFLQRTNKRVEVQKCWKSRGKNFPYQNNVGEISGFRLLMMSLTSHTPLARPNGRFFIVWTIIYRLRMGQWDF